MDYDKISLISSYISRKSGLVFREKNLSALKSSIEKRLVFFGFDDILQYYMYLKFSEEGQNEIKNLYNLITVNETEFFRDRHRLRALTEKIIPEILDKKISSTVINGTPPLISIWSAGCSSGEEPYSIAISLNEHRAQRFWYNIELLATDINTDVLSITLESIYDKRRMKNVDDRIKKKYFNENNGGFQLTDNIRKIINFRYHNLIDEPVPFSSQKLWDIIVCQNVIIYFDKTTIEKLLEQFYHSLVDGGYLILGFSESLYGIPNLFTTIYYEKIALHQKITKKSVEMPPDKRRKPAKKSIPQTPQEVKEKKYSYDEAAELFKNEDIDSAQEMVMKHLKEHQDDEQAHFLYGKILFEKGLYREAEFEFKICLALNSSEPLVHYFLGLVYYRQDQPDDVIRFLKKALYLDKENALARLHLADAYAMINDIQNAKREYENTIKCLKKYPPENTLPLSKEIKCGSIIETCIKRLKEF
ncbi:MAG: CheR family methyltransferase [Candidatus Xenobiia bacterium LiM19]